MTNKIKCYFVATISLEHAVNFLITIIDIQYNKIVHKLHQVQGPVVWFTLWYIPP